MEKEVYVVEAVRTPVGRRNGILSVLPPDELLNQVLQDLVKRSGIEPHIIEDIIVGCVTQTGEQGNNIARISALLAEIPATVPATVLNRKCGSSQQAIHFAAQAILAGDADVVVAAGVESMSRVPIGSDRAPNTEDLLSRCKIPHQGVAAELISEKWALTREQLDEFSLRSHQLAGNASEKGYFKSEIIPVRLPDGTLFSKDEGIRHNTSLQKLSQLETPFKENGVVTAGSSSQISDGASALLLMSPEKAKSLGIKPLASIKARVVVGSDQTLMLTGPIDATSKALNKTGLSLDNINVVEINEAFASVVLAWNKEMECKMSKVNPRGGAIALGHPTGASGARIATTLIHEMRQNGWKYGLQTMCIAHGMATATIYENLN